MPYSGAKTVAEKTKIEWATHTQNFWIGCQEMGPPCDHCYAREMNKRWRWVDGWGPHGERKRTSEANWKKPLQWAKVVRGTGVRPRVFTLSLGDWLDNQAPQQWRIDMGAVIEATPELDWLLLTKRIQNYAKLKPWSSVPANVWLGITCGDQAEYNRDWPILSRIGAPVRFISNEPALGLLDPTGPSAGLPDWIIQGGESGPEHRDMPLGWARDLRDSCARLGIAYFFKQTAGKGDIPVDLQIRQFPTPRAIEALAA